MTRVCIPLRKKNRTDMKRFLNSLLIVFSLLSPALFSCSDKMETIGLRRGDSAVRNQHREEPEAQPGEFVPAGPEGPFAGDDSLAAPPLSEGPVPPRIYACGVEHPDAQAPMFVVFRDGVRIRQFCLGQKAEADSHFLDGPDMYVAASGGQSTVVYRNGERLFSIPSREFVASLLVRPDGIWTLGVSRDEDGFVLRRDGAVFFSKTNGVPGRLYEDEGHLCFEYSLTVGNRSFRYLVMDGSDFALTSPYSSNILSSVLSEGKLWFLESSLRGWRITGESGEYYYPNRLNSELRSADLYGMPGGCAAVLSFDGLMEDVAELVIIGGESWLKSAGDASYHYFALSPDIHVTYSEEGNTLRVSGFLGEYEETISGARLESGRCAAQYGEQFYMACTSTDGSPPFIWKRGNMKMNLAMDGYLTGISVVGQD